MVLPNVEQGQGAVRSPQEFRALACPAGGLLGVVSGTDDEEVSVGTAKELPWLCQCQVLPPGRMHKKEKC